MTDIQKVSLLVCYDDYEEHEVSPFYIGIWRLSDTDDLNNLAHLEPNGITKPLIERYGKSVLRIDLKEDHHNPDTRQRLQEIYKAIPVSDTAICQIHMHDVGGYVGIYGDNILASIDRLVVMGVVTESIGSSLAKAFHETMKLDNITSPDGIAARSAAARRVQPVSEAGTLDSK